MVVVHGLSFPGLFRRDGLLGAGPQTTAWLYAFWHLGFPIAVIAYAWLKDESSGRRRRLRSRQRAVRHRRGVRRGCRPDAARHVRPRLLPEVMRGNGYTPVLPVRGGGNLRCWRWLRSSSSGEARGAARSTYGSWWRCARGSSTSHSVRCSMAGRFDLGFYAGRLYGLLAATFVLIVLLDQDGRALRQALAAARHRADRTQARKRHASAHLRHFPRSDLRRRPPGQRHAGKPELRDHPRLSTRPRWSGAAPSSSSTRRISNSTRNEMRKASRGELHPQLRLPLRPQGRPHRSAELEGRLVGARSAALLRRPRHDGTRRAGAATASGPEDGGDRSTDGRHRARLQQHPGRHHRHDRTHGRRRRQGSESCRRWSSRSTSWPSAVPSSCSACWRLRASSRWNRASSM